jgi:hypothetical protein
VLLVPEGVVLGFLLVVNVAVIVLVFIHSAISFVLHLAVIAHLVLSLLTSALLELLMLGHLARHDIVLSDLLPLIVLVRLPLLEGLQAHPILVAVSLPLIYHIFLNLFTAVEIAHVRHFLSFVNLFLHQPIIHRFSSVCVLVTLQLCHIEKLFFDLVLGLAD